MNTRKTNILSSIAATLVAAIALVMSSCSADDEMLTDNRTEFDNVVRIGAVIDDMATRAGYTTDNLTEFGIFIKNSHNSEFSYDNVKVTKQADGSWKTEKTMKWESEEQPVDIVAYAPYNRNIGYKENDFEIKIDQSGGSKNSDLVLFKRKDFVPTEGQGLVNGKVQIAFKHLMSRVNINVKIDPSQGSFTTNPITGMQIYCSGRYRGKCDFTADEPTVTVNNLFSTTSSITLETLGFTGTNGTETATAQYSCVVIPQAVTANELKIMFSFNGSSISWTSPKDYTFTGGKETTITINVK